VRLKIRQRFGMTKPFKLLLPEATIYVYMTNHSTLRWTWTDGSSASMGFPVYWRHHAKGNFVAGKLHVTSGVRHVPFIGAYSTEWVCGNDTLLDKHGWCGGTIYGTDRRRLACWRLRCGGGECVLSDSLSDELRGIVLGIVIGSLYRGG